MRKEWWTGRGEEYSEWCGDVSVAGGLAHSLGVGPGLVLRPLPPLVTPQDSVQCPLPPLVMLLDSCSVLFPLLVVLQDSVQRPRTPLVMLQDPALRPPPALLHHRRQVQHSSILAPAGCGSCGGCQAPLSLNAYLSCVGKKSLYYSASRYLTEFISSVQNSVTLHNHVA